jgi:hypothetical protein
MGILMFNSSLFDEKERNIIIMALMYLKNDYTLRDLKELGYGKTIDEFTDQSSPVKLDEAQREARRCIEVACGGTFEDVVQNLMEDIIGPTWDEKATTANLTTETAKRTRHKS